MRVQERTAELAKANEALQAEVTERKRAEEQLQHYTAGLEQANEELKRFTYVASHNLRAPLVNLKGFAAELRAALAVIGSAVITALPHLDERRRPAVTMALQKDLPEALGFIDSSVTRMDRLVNALLELSRLNRGELKLEPVDMNALVQATLQTLAHQIEGRQVSVTVGSLPTVVADRTSMEQIMGNLLNNVVIYLDPGRPGEIEVTAERDGDETTFRVRDNGCGIAEEDMDKVFAPFRRAGKQDVPGEGVGLAYVQTLVRRHGGRIWCESELGVGTTFTFTISNHLAK
jgi:signal transduction histidine kinase